ncbi:type IV secretion system protein [Bartonella acomydis]|uniref:P-type DNA transfer protein VirB5 n=1 Tax=Bartonella acomydis TaxID=686234 RepID=A0ABP9MVW1_9HYPH
MKKLIVATTISIFLGTSNFTLRAQENEGVRAQENEEVRAQENEEALSNQLLNIMNEQLRYTKTQLNEIEKIHHSITGIRIPNSEMKKADNGLLLMEPKYIYDEDNEKEISERFPQLIENIKKQEEEYSQKPTVHEIRTLIDLRSQYAAVIDKVVSLQVFEETESRFMQIAQHLMAIKDTRDLKGIIELQTQIKSILAMIQNEATKLQMVAHLRNAEQELIRQQKYKRNIRILNHQNSQMPAVQLQYARALQ